MPTTTTRAEQMTVKRKKRLSLRSMFNHDMWSLRPELLDLNESRFKKEIVRRYKAEIVNCGILLIRLKLYEESLLGLEKIESKLKLVAGPLDIDFVSFNKSKKNLIELFIPHNIIKLKANTSIDKLETLFEGIYFATDVSPKKRLHLQNSVKRTFYECIALVDWCIALRFPNDHTNTFDWFLDENVLKYENLLRLLRQSHSPRIDKNETDRARINKETFKRSYQNNTKHLWSDKV